MATRLNLDYAGPKRRVEGGGATPPRGEVAPRFVELSTPAASMASATERAECIVEMGNARGAKIRVELSGQGLAGLAGLCSAFWSA